MDTHSIREVVKKQPFRPFMLRMNDGREFHVVHPEFLMVSGLNVVFVDDSETVIHLEPELIASLHVRKNKPTPKTPQ
jgi:hypothetical protein